DQRTMFYTSEGRKIKRYDVSGSGTQLSDFATLPGSDPPFRAYAFRLLPPGDGSGGLLVADSDNIKRLDGSGNVVQTYDAPNVGDWFALNLDANGTSFWSENKDNGAIYKFNIASGDIERQIQAIASSTHGLCSKGEITTVQMRSANFEVRLYEGQDKF